jgi:hypothetical protein
MAFSLWFTWLEAVLIYTHRGSEEKGLLSLINLLVILKILSSRLLNMKKSMNDAHVSFLDS